MCRDSAADSTALGMRMQLAVLAGLLPAGGALLAGLLPPVEPAGGVACACARGIGTPRPARRPATSARGGALAMSGGGGLSTSDPRLVGATLARVTGIDFGCDLSLRWAYIMGLTPDGSAERSGELRVGDQLVAISGQSVIGLPVAQVMDVLAAVEGAEVELLFFRGDRETLQRLVDAPTDAPATVRVTLQQQGQPDRTLDIPYGANLRDELVAREISVYQSVARWTNCNGKQLCGTCIVDVVEGVDSCTRRSIDEASTLRENPPTYKLACITGVYGDVTVRLKPKVGAAQWTR